MSSTSARFHKFKCEHPEWSHEQCKRRYAGGGSSSSLRVTTGREGLNSRSRRYHGGANGDDPTAPGATEAAAVAPAGDATPATTPPAGDAAPATPPTGDVTPATGDTTPVTGDTTPATPPTGEATPTPTTPPTGEVTPTPTTPPTGADPATPTTPPAGAPDPGTPPAAIDVNAAPETGTAVPETPSAQPGAAPTVSAAKGAATKRVRGVRQPNRKTRGAVTSMLDEFEKNLGKRSSRAKLQAEDVHKTADAFVGIAQVVQTRCDAQIGELQKEVDDLEQKAADQLSQIAGAEQKYAEIQRTLDNLTREQASRIIIDMGIRWIEEKERWAPGNVGEEPYYQYFLGLGHIIVKALNQIASLLRLETAGEPETVQVAVWERWNGIIEQFGSETASPSHDEVIAAFNALIGRTPGTETSEGVAGTRDTYAPQDWFPTGVTSQELGGFVDSLLLKNLRSTENEVKAQLDADRAYLQTSLATLDEIATREPRSNIAKRVPWVIDITMDSRVLAATQFKTARLDEETADNTLRLDLMQRLISTIPKLMRVLWVDTDEFAAASGTATAQSAATDSAPTKSAVEDTTLPLISAPKKASKRGIKVSAAIPTFEAPASPRASKRGSKVGFGTGQPRPERPIPTS